MRPGAVDASTRSVHAVYEDGETSTATTPQIQVRVVYVSFLSALSSLQELCYASKVYEALSVRRNQLDALKQAFVAPAQNKDIIDLFHRKWIRKRDTAIENKQDIKAERLTHMITLLQQGRNMQASEGDKQRAIDQLKDVITDKILKISHKVERLADYLDIAPLRGETLSASMSEQLENKIRNQRQLVAQYYDTLLCPVAMSAYGLYTQNNSFCGQAEISESRECTSST